MFGREHALRSFVVNPLVHICRKEKSHWKLGLRDHEFLNQYCTYFSKFIKRSVVFANVVFF